MLSVERVLNLEYSFKLSELQTALVWVMAAKSLFPIVIDVAWGDKLSRWI